MLPNQDSGGIAGRDTSQDEQIYLRTHARRYERLLDLVAEAPPETILVVGPSFETELLRQRFPGARVDTLGWHDNRFPLRDGDRHTQFDLNDTDYPELEPHDVVVCGEVIEHLRVPAVPVLRFLATGLGPDGRLILQTPNAAGLPKRLRMLLGRNPYDPIRGDAWNPGHFHEFTVGELLAALGEAGLGVERWFTENYFDHGSRKNRVFRAVGPVLPRTLREGITVVARNNR